MLDTVVLPIGSLSALLHIDMHIMVAGDSWACGEWGQTDSGYGLLHSGITTEMESQGHRVYRTAQGGDSNRSQLHRVTLALAEQAHTDAVLFIQTDPLRDLSASHMPTTLKGYRSAHSLLLRDLYQALNDLPVPILLVGGNCAVDPALVSEFPHVHTVCRDWIALLLGSRPCEIICRQWTYPHCEVDLLTHWESEERAHFRWFHKCNTPTTQHYKWFWPDGLHPNRAGHAALLTHIQSQGLLLPGVVAEPDLG